MTRPKREKNRWTDRRTVKIAAPPERVWDAWAHPDKLAQWFPESARGEAVPGGKLTHVFEKFGVEIVHEVIEAVPGQRLVLEAVGPTGVPFRQEIIVRREGGETVLELVHSGFDDGADWGDEFEGIDSGWTMVLAVLRHYLERYHGHARANYFVMRPATFAFEDLEAWFRSEQGLAHWLTRSGSIGDVGQPFELALQTGRSVHGEVLAWTGREACISWAEADGVLELKAFSIGPRGKAIGLRGCSWADTPPAVAEVEAWMTEALDRLAENMTAP